MNPRFHLFLSAACAALGLGLRAQERDPIHGQALAWLRADALERDEPEASARDLLAAIEGAPASPFGEQLALWLGGRLARLRDRGPLLDRVRGLISVADLHGFTRQRLEGILAAEAEVQGKGEEADALESHQVQATHFMAAGPFGDGGSYFHRVPYPPEQAQLDPGVAMPGRFGRLHWRKALRRPDQRSVTLEVRGPRHEGCFYGLHQVDAPSARPAWLVVQSSSSLEVFGNGRKLLDADRNADWLPQRLIVPIALRAGRNHVLVKTTGPWSSSFSLQYVDAAGRPMTDLKEETGARIQPWAAAPAGESAPGAFADGAAYLLAQKDPTPAELCAAGRVRIQEGQPSVGLELVQRAADQAPEDLLVQAALCEALGEARHLPEDSTRARRRPVVEKLLARAPEHLLARIRMAQILSAEDKKEDAIKSLGELLAKHPDSLRLRRALLESYDSLKWSVEADKLAQETLERFPEERELLERRLRTLMEGGQLAQAEALVRERLTRRPGDGFLLQTLRSVLLRTGRSGEAHDILVRQNRRDPDSYALLLERAEVLARDPANLPRARKLLEEAAAREPETPEALVRLGDLCQRLGDIAATDAAWQQALERDPSQHDLRRRLTRLRGQPEFPELAPWRPDAAALLKGFQPRPGDEASVTTLVLDHMILRVYEDGSVCEETHQIRRINDAQGIEAREEAPRAASADELLVLRTLTPDGQSFLPHKVEDAFSMPRLKPGVFIEEQYRNFRGGPGAAAMALTKFTFQSTDEPYVLSRLVVILPAKWSRGRFVVRNFGPPAQVVEQDGLQVHVFEKRDVPRVVEEDNAPPLDELVPWVTFGEDQSWHVGARDWQANLQRQTRGSREVEAATAAALKGVTGDRARAQALWQFVNHEIPDLPGRADPTTILAKKEGSRWVLFAAMLRAAGVPFHFAIFRAHSPETDPQPEPLFAGEPYYQRVALRIEPRDGEPQWCFEGAPRHYPLGALLVAPGTTMAGARGLLLLGEQGLPVALPGADPRDHGIGIQGRLLLKKGGGGDLELEVRLPGVLAFALKEQVKKMNANLRTVVAGQVAQEVFPGWTVRKVEYLGLDQDDEPLHVKALLRKGKVLETVGDSLVVTLPLQKSRLTEQLAGKGNRVHPFVWQQVMTADMKVVLDPGDAYEVKGLPEPVLLRRQLMDFGLTFTRSGRTVEIERALQLLPGRITPEEFPAWIALCRAVDDAEDQRILIAER